MDDGDDRVLVVLDPARVTVKQYQKPAVRFSDALALEVCDTIATSSLGIIKLSETKPHWPSFVTIYRWRNQYPNFNEMFVRAMQMRAAMFIDEIVQITDDASNDLIEIEGRMVPNPVSVQRAKLRAEYREKVAKRLDPATWGDKLDLNAQLGYLSQEDAIRQLK